jgi:hypothetical protein
MDAADSMAADDELRMKSGSIFLMRQNQAAGSAADLKSAGDTNGP